MPLNLASVRAALKELAQVRVGDKVHFGQSHGKPTFGIDRKGVFQGFGRRAADSISEVANQKEIANILMAGTEEVSCGRISSSELQQALAGLANLTGSYQSRIPGSGKQLRHAAATNLHQQLTRMVQEVEQWDKPCLALVPGRKEDLELTAGSEAEAPFDTWFGHVRQWLETDVTGTNNDWKEYVSGSGVKDDTGRTPPLNHHEPDGKEGSFILPLLKNHRINPQDSGYPTQVFKDDLNLTVGIGLSGGGGLKDIEYPTYKKNRYQPVPAQAVEQLNWATGGDKALVYAALLMAHQGLMPGAMGAVSRNLTLLSSGAAVPPSYPGNLHQAKDHGTSLHINTGSRSMLRVTYIMDLSEEKGAQALREHLGALTPVTKWIARVVIEATLTRAASAIQFQLSRIRFKLQVAEV